MDTTARDWAESGAAWLTGHPDGPPLLPPGDAATYARRMSDHIEYACGVELDGAALLSERAAFTGGRRRGARSVGGSCRLLPTSDGWAAVSNARPDDPMLLGALVGGVDGHDVDEAVARWVREHPGAELQERAGLLSVAASSAVPRTFALPSPGRPRPVEDLLVVDFSALWAGPLCAHVLGLAGARVVKVETPGRPDGARSGNAEFYDLLHGGHWSVVLDPGEPSGRAALHALVGKADVVIEASRPRALAGFGLDAAEFVAGGGTWVSITAWGRGSDRVGFGDDVAAACGLMARDQAGLPVFCGDAIADPLTGLTAAALVLSEPAGTLWEVPMAAVVSATVPQPWSPAPSEPATGAVPPVARAPFAAAPASGADTREVLSALGIPAP